MQLDSGLEITLKEMEEEMLNWIISGKVDLENLKTQEDSVAVLFACLSFHKVFIPKKVFIAVHKYHENQVNFWSAVETASLWWLLKEPWKSLHPAESLFQLRL